MTIGYYVDDGYVTSVPAMRRAVLETVAKLRRNGHTVLSGYSPPAESLTYSFKPNLFLPRHFLTCHIIVQCQLV